MIPVIIAHLWQSTLFGAAAWIVTLALRTNRAAVRYRVWFTASVKFLVPFSLLVKLGTLVPHRSTAPAIRAEWVAAIQQFSQPLPAYTIPARSAVTSGVTNHSWFIDALLILWACGFAAIAICWLLRWRRVQILRKSARSVTLPTALQIPASVMSAPGLIEPGVVGILRPVLLLPEGIAERLNQTQLDAILAHELSHVRRRDNLTASIHMAVQAIFWFHPMTWWIGARLLDERERSCDEEVLRHGCRPSLYAESIIEVCRWYVSSPLACVSGVTGSDLTRRIEAIMRNRRLRGLHPAKKVALAIAGLAVLALPIIIGAQAQDAKPRFEVASIKPNNGCHNPTNVGSFNPSPGLLEIPCQTLRSLIQLAYGVFGDGVSVDPRPLHMEGGPSWTGSEYYSISAKASGPVSTEILAGPMLQALLEERFQLKTHRETREMPVYALTVGKAGIKMQPLAEGACVPIDLAHPPPLPKPGDPPPNVCGLMMIRTTGEGNVVIELRGSTMTQLAQRLSQFVDRTVVDKTGITGRFNFHVEFTPDPNMPNQAPPGGRGADAANPAPPIDAGPNLFVAVQEQIGLKLSSDKGPVSYLIIDHVEKPTPN